MFWDEIVGHDDNLKMLQTMLHAGRLPHALLFAGPDGIGKMMVAKATAAALLCHGSPDTDPCGQCLSCRQVSRLASPNVTVVAPEGNSIKIEQIRALQHEAALVSSGWRICVIEQAERMTTQAANSLLKLLEEPPPQLIFILLASSPHLMLGTIISRCLLIRFLPLPHAILAKALIARGCATGPANVAARLSGGRMGAALELCQPEGLELRNQALMIFAKLPEGDLSLAWETSAALDKADNKHVQDLLSYFTILIRDTTLLASGQAQEMLFNADCLQQLLMAAAEWQPDQLFQAMAKIRAAGLALKGNANTRLTLEALIIELMDLVKEGRNVAYSRRCTL